MSTNYDSSLGAKRSRILARRAREAKLYAVWMKVLLAALATLVLLTAIVYIVSVLYSRYGSFTVGVNKYEFSKYGLTLCETPDFLDATSQLNAKANEYVTNMSGKNIPANVDNINGLHSDDNYLAYTFYLKNCGTDTVTFEYYTYITNVTNNLDTAIRFRIYIDGEYTDYAMTRTDGGGAEPGTVEFLTKNVVTRKQIKDFIPGAMKKITVVIWIEGDDPDCTDDLLEGMLKSDMTFSIVETAYDENN